MRSHIACSCQQGLEHANECESLCACLLAHDASLALKCTRCCSSSTNMASTASTSKVKELQPTSRSDQVTTVLRAQLTDPNLAGLQSGGLKTQYIHPAFVFFLGKNLHLLAEIRRRQSGVWMAVRNLVFRRNLLSKPKAFGTATFWACCAGSPKPYVEILNTWKERVPRIWGKEKDVFLPR